MPSIKDIAKGGLMHAAETIVKDAKYIPEDKFCFCPMGCAKTAEAILREIAVGNVKLATAIKGEEPSAEFEAKAGQATTIDALGALVMESAGIACAAIDTIADEDMEKLAKMPWGASFPMFVAIFLPSQHMTYHDGQINYIQTLLGDSTFHWIEG
jgi:hypothetical protein